MKKHILWITLIISATVLFLHCQKAVIEAPVYDTRLVLVNPGLGDVRSMVRMMEMGVINIQNAELLAVYYEKAERTPQAVQSYCEENQIHFVRTETIAGDLHEQNLFQKNGCSDAFRRLFENSDGVFFFGGPDFPPVIYGQKTNLLTYITMPNRHYFELSFLFHLLGGYQDAGFRSYLKDNPDYVIVGFCLGMQTMNVSTGGTMYQDIPTEIYGLQFVEDILSQHQNDRHTNYWRRVAPNENLMWANFHQIAFIPDGFFTKQMKLDPGDHPYVCSSHHQALKDIGKGFEIAATSMDGKIVEAISHSRFPNVLGVQFHPEALGIYSEREGGFKLTPADTVLVSEHTVLKEANSLNFHLEFWKYVSSLFSK